MWEVFGCTYILLIGLANKIDKNTGKLIKYDLLTLVGSLQFRK